MFEPLNGMNADIEKLSFLDDLLAAKRVVYLGEEDHWIHEKNEYRILMLRYLFSRGWRYAGEELGWSDGIRINHYLETGELSYLDRIATYGYRGDVRNDRQDKTSGILKDSSDNYPIKEFRAEQIRFAKTLRDCNENCLTESGKVRYFGFDVNAAAGGGYEDIRELLSPVENAPELAELHKLLTIIPDETMEQEINRLSHILRTVDDKIIILKKLLGEKCYAHLQQCLCTMRDSFDYFRVANPATNYKALNKAMAAREEMMYRNVKFILSQMEPKDKLILMGHNRHLSKDIGSIKNLGASPPGGKLVPSLGTLINRLLPGQVFSIWMLYDHGRSSQPFTWLSNEYTSKPGSLNAILAEIGSTYLLPTVTMDARADLLKSEMDIVGIYNATFCTAISKQADAIFFINKVNPLMS
jgi:Erythromycin esterase homolog